MATRLQIRIENLPRELQKLAQHSKEAISRGLRNSAHRARTRLVQATPVDTGQAKNAWRVKANLAKRGIQSYDVVNEAPYIGIIEKGARPHPVNEEGIQSIAQWVRRHFPAASNDEVANITNGIVWKLRRYGQKPTHFIKNLIPQIQQDLVTEVQRELMKGLP